MIRLAWKGGEPAIGQHYTGIRLTFIAVHFRQSYNRKVNTNEKD